MKVYVITSGEYSDYHIDAVSLNKDDADIMARHVGGMVEEYNTDDYCVNPRWGWDVRVSIDFCPHRIYIKPDTIRIYSYSDKTLNIHSETAKELSERAKRPSHNKFTKEYFLLFNVYTKAHNAKAQALKIAQDLIAQANYILTEEGY